MDRLPILSALRAVAAMMVCMYHAAFLFAEDFPNWVQILDFGQEGVYVFFVISGLVMPMALEKMKYQFRDFWIFMMKRCLRLQPPLILSAAIMTLLSYKTLMAGNVAAVWLFLGSATLTAPLFNLPFVNDIYWTLFVEMQYYVYIALLCPLLTRTGWQLRSILILILLFISCGSIAFEGKWIKLLLPFHLPVFLMGFYSYLSLTNRASRMEIVSGIALCTFFCIVVTEFAHGLGYRITIVSLATTIILSVYRSGVGWLNELGEYSYSLYLFHWVFISLMAHYARPYLTGGWGAITLYLFVMALSISGAMIFYRIIEKPSLSWARKFVNKKTPPETVK